MKKITQLLEQFDMDLLEIDKEYYTPLDNFNEKIAITSLLIQQLRIILRDNEFYSKNDEIHFFKVQKPYVQGRLEYYARKKYYIQEFPLHSTMNQREFIVKAITKIEEYNRKYFHFINYYYLNKTDLDQFFFLRENNTFDLFLGGFFNYEDTNFSSNHDLLIAKIISNDLLLKFYNKQLAILEGKLKGSQEVVESFKYNWTNSKTGLLELLKGVVESKSINNGNVDMKHFITHCSKRLEVNLDNYNQIYAQIKSRKKDSTKFIDKLKYSLINWMKSENEKL